jgi:hypothetical protein
MRSMLQLSVDGRDLKQVSKIMSIIKTAKLPARHGNKFYESFGLSSVSDSFNLGQIFLIVWLNSLFKNKKMKTFLAPSKRKTITYPALKRAKINLEI